MYIDISTEEKKKSIKELFLSFNKKGNIFRYYGVSDNNSNTNYVNNLLNELEIDKNYYKKGKNKKYCLYCGKELIKGDPRKKFCNSSCAAKYNNNGRILSEETKNKIRFAILEKHCSDKSDNVEKLKICKYCGRTFNSKLHIKQECCSRVCARNYRRLKDIQNIEEQQIYRSQAKFKFALNSYPNEFDFGLIKESGWYKATNHGDNLKGISRDHMFSVDEGYKQCIDPYLISHPANCKLMKHEDNFKKLTKCSITLDELLDRVNKWNNKYGIYENNINYDKIERFKANWCNMCP